MYFLEKAPLPDAIEHMAIPMVLGIRIVYLNENGESLINKCRIIEIIRTFSDELSIPKFKICARNREDKRLTPIF